MVGRPYSSISATFVCLCFLFLILRWIVRCFGPGRYRNAIYSYYCYHQAQEVMRHKYNNNNNWYCMIPINVQASELVHIIHTGL